MNIGLTYDLQTDPADERQAEFDPPRTIEAVDRALRTLGHDVVHLGNAAQLLEAQGRLQDVALVFNLAEGSHGRCREAWVPMLLEQWGVPFVGSSTPAQTLGLDKVMSKRVARASGLLTPEWVVVDRPEALAGIASWRFPLIVKPRHEGSGRGIDPGAVVHDLETLRRRVDWLWRRLQQPCLIEQFVPFGELTVLLIGNGPPCALPAIQRPLDPVSRLSCHVVPQGGTERWLTPVTLTPELERCAQRAALTLFEAIGCRDVARVDLRVDEQGRVYVLEINPLPSFDPEGSLGLIAEHLGRSYAHMVGRILQAALHRLGLAVELSHWSGER